MKQILQYLFTTSFLFIALMFAGGQAWGQIASWDPEPLPGGNNNFGPSPWSASAKDVNVTSANIFRGIGIGTSGTAAANAWGGNDFRASGSSFATALSDNEFVNIEITSSSGYAMSFSDIAPYNIRRSGAGPTTGRWQYSIDNGSTFNDIGTDITWGGTTSNSGNNQVSISLNGINDLQNVSGKVIFRIVLWGATNTGGTWYVNAHSNVNAAFDELIFNGSLTTIPTSEAIALEFSNVPSIVYENVPFDLNVCAVDENGAAVSSYTDPILLTQLTGTPATVSPSSPVTPVEGCVTFTITPQSGGETISFEATSGTLIAAVTGNIEVTEPCTIPLDVIGASAMSDNQSASVTWILPDCFDEILVVANETAGISFVPTGDGSAYMANPVYTAPDQVVYKGSGTSVNVTGLTNGITYYFELFTRKGTSWSSGVEVSAIPDIDAINVPNIAALRAMWDDNTTQVYRLTGEAVMTFKAASRNQKYIQDATDAILIDDPNPAKITTNYNMGDGITNITGTLNVFGTNLLQFVPITDPGTPSSTGNIVVPEVISMAQLNTGNYDAHLVKIENVTFAVNGNFETSTNYVINDGSTNGILRAHYPNNPIVDYIGTAIPTTSKNIVGVVYNNTGGVVNQLIPRNLADFQCAPVEIMEELAIAGSEEVLISWVNPTNCFDQILVVARHNTPNDGIPSGDGSAYMADELFGSGTPLGNGFVVFKGIGTSVNVSGLIDETTYYFKIFTYSYETGLWSSGVELMATPTSICNTVEVINPMVNPGNSTADVSWIHPGICASTILVVASEGIANTGVPTGDGSAYIADNQFGSGSALGNGFVVYHGSTTSVNVTALTNGNQYYFKIYTYSADNAAWSNGVEVSALPNFPAYSIWSNPIDALNPSEYNPYTTGDIVTDHLTVTGIGRGSGITGVLANGRYNANSWNTGVFDASAYFNFGLTPDSGYKLSFEALELTYQSSNTGPVSYEVRSSLDNYSTSIMSGTLTNDGSGNNMIIDLSGTIFQNLEETIVFRFYAWGASTATGSLSINDFEFVGSINAGAALVNVSPEILSGFGYRGFGPSDAQIFTVDGEGLSSNVEVDASADYEISLDGLSFGSNVSIVPVGGNITNQDVYVRLASGRLPGLYNGDATLTYAGGDAKVVTLNGKVLVPFTLPYSNSFTTTADYNAAVDTSFVFDGITHLTSNGGYLRFDNPGASVVTPPIDFSVYGTLHLQFNHNTGGPSSILSVLVSNDNGITYTPVFDFNSNATAVVEDVFINLGDYTAAQQGRLKFVSLSGNDVRLRNLMLDAFVGNAILNQGEVIIDRLTIGQGAMIELVETILTVNDHVNRPGTEGYIITSDEGAYLHIPSVGLDDVVFNIGTANTYLPVTISVGEGLEYFFVNVKENIDEDLCSGADPNKSVPATWEIFSEADPALTSLTFDFTDAVLPAEFNAEAAKIIHCVDPLEEFGEVTGTIATTTGGFSSFSPFSITSDPVILPVSWLFVKARPIEKNTVEVSWGTAAETLNNFFEIERSTDGVHFSTIGKVQAVGNSLVPNFYTFKDLYPVNGRNYYRIKQTDFSSAYSWSNVASATIETDKMAIVHAINKVRFEGDIDGARATVFTLGGHPILTTIINTNSMLDLSSFVSGVYVVKLTKDGNAIIEKIVVQ